jgi:hypothetical protein
VRRSTAAISNSNWASATLVGTFDVTGPAGTPYCTVTSGLPTCTTYYYAVRTMYNGGGVSDVGPSTSGTTRCTAGWGVICDDGLRYERGDDTNGDLPAALEFSLPRPSPASNEAWFDLAIPAASAGEPMTLTIHDLLGRRIREVVNEPARAGRRAIQWRLDTDSGTRVPRGIYFAKLRIGSQAFTRSVIAQP